MSLNNAFGGTGDSNIKKIIDITERMDRIQRAIDKIRYNDELLEALPDLVVKLSAAKDACIAELKTL
ncbi:MAG: hypothetical protein LBU88_00320 [Treponema sp.]|jgi:hypothetical protein|nr:hypothetical protein [Treponema sp.]